MKKSTQSAFHRPLAGPKCTNNTATITALRRSGRLPPLDIRLSRKAISWKPEMIKNFVENGGMQIWGG